MAKMAAYGFGNHSLKFFLTYLSERNHRVRIGSYLSEFLDFFAVLGPSLFNIFINDLLLSVTETDICNLADDNTIYAYDTNIAKVITRLQNDLNFALYRFSINGLVANPDKFQVIFPGTERSSNNVIKIGDLIFPSTEEVKLLGITFDRQLTFYPHIQNMCKAASNKIKALLRIRGFLTQNQTDLILNAYVFSAFNYCPLVWMFCSKKAHNLIDKTFITGFCVQNITPFLIIFQIY